jgi:phenylacetate-CoA ligase
VGFPYFQSEEITQSCKEMEEIQLEKLKWQVKRCYEQVPMYRKKFDQLGLKPAHIKKLSDIQKIPFTEKEELRQFYPDGILAVPKKKICHYHMTSGTTGTPVTIAHSYNDWQRLAQLQARQFVMQGLGEGDLLYQGYGLGTWIGGGSAEIGAHMAKIRVLPVGPGRTEVGMQWIKDFGVNGITCTPSFMMYILEKAREQEINPQKDWQTLRMSNMGGEAWSLGLRDRIEKNMPAGFMAHNQYGTTELGGPIVGASCPVSQEEGYMHSWADAYLIEVIDPETGASKEPGEEGELVVTTLEREAAPILRFRTRDLTSLHAEPFNCTCGRRSHPLLRWLTGRTDDIIKVRGTMVSPRWVEEIITRIDGVAESWLMEIERKAGRMENMTVRLELVPANYENEDKKNELRKLIANTLSSKLGLRVDVEVALPGELPRFERKSARVVYKSRE